MEVYQQRGGEDVERGGNVKVEISDLIPKKDKWRWRRVHPFIFISRRFFGFLITVFVLVAIMSLPCSN